MRNNLIKKYSILRALECAYALQWQDLTFSDNNQFAYDEARKLEIVMRLTFW